MPGFLISGEFITRHARDRVFEYGPDDALRFLRTSVEGLPLELAGEILAGEKRIVGDSRAGIDVAADDDPADAAARTDLADRYRFRYSGVWYDRSAKLHMRPYARVTGWGPEDMHEKRVPNRYTPKPAASMLDRCAGGDPEAWSLFRSVHYMTDPVNDRAVRMRLPGAHRDTVVLWSVCSTPPLWITPAADPCVALTAWLAANGELPECGSHIDTARDRMVAGTGVTRDAPRQGLGEVTATPGPVPEREPDAPKPTVDLIRSLLPADTPEHVAAGIMRLHADEAPPVPVRTTDPAAVEYAWVARDGAFWACRGYMDHIATAQGIATELGWNLDRWKGNAERAAEEMGWVKVGRDARHQPFWFLEVSRTPGAAQFEAVVRWLVTHKADPMVTQEWADRVK